MLKVDHWKEKHSKIIINTQQSKAIYCRNKHVKSLTLWSKVEWLHSQRFPLTMVKLNYIQVHYLVKNKERFMLNLSILKRISFRYKNIYIKKSDHLGVSVHKWYVSWEIKGISEKNVLNYLKISIGIQNTISLASQFLRYLTIPY